MSNPNDELIIKSTLWARENQELIDYLNVSFTNIYMRVNTSGTIRRENNDIKYIVGENLPKTDIDLVKVQKKRDGKYVINCGTWPKDLAKLSKEQATYIVYTGLTLKDLNKIKRRRYYKLSQGDIIKLGRMLLKVLEIHTIKDLDKKNLKKKAPILKSSNSSNLIINEQQIIKGAFSPKFNNKLSSHIIFNKNDLILNTSKTKKLILEDESFDIFKRRKISILPRINSTNELFMLKKVSSKFKHMNSSKNLFFPKPPLRSKGNPVCRICYGEENNEENPLLCPCLCKGSMKYIHYKCLKNWLNSKIEEELSEESFEKDPDCIVYNRKDISCELCKEKFPDYLIHNNNYYNILFYQPSFNEFIIFETLKEGRENHKYYYILNLDKKDTYNIGRASECDMSLSELSVSRFHCILHKEDGKIYLEDNTSKFGTLILIQNKNMIVNELLPLKIQAKKVFIKFKLKKSFNFNCCAGNDTIEDYQIQNRKCFDVLSYFVIKEDDYNNLLSDDEDNKSCNNNNNDIKKNNETNNELIDKESINKDINDNISIKNNIDINKEADEILIDEKSLIDKSISIGSLNIYKNNNSDKNIWNIKLNHNLINNDYESNEMPKLHTTRFKKMSIRKGKKDGLELPKLDKINLQNIKDNISMSLLFDINSKRNKKLIYINHNSKDEINMKSVDQNDSFINSKPNNKNSKKEK